MGSVDAMIAAARGQLGEPYVWGGEDPDEGGFDCSGLTQWSAARGGLSLPRTAAAQQKSTTPVTSPRPGDLVFFGSPAHHVGLYLGGGKMIHSPHSGDVVRIADVGSPTGYGRINGATAIASAVSTAAAVPAGWFGVDTADVQAWLVRAGAVIAGVTLAAVGIVRATGARKGSA